MIDKMIFPIGIQHFESLRNDGYVYVDKTALINLLVKTGRYYFLSRPRRFGKSLLLSTIKAYYEGKKELFEGLAIAELETEWRVHPVLHLDLNIEKYDEAGQLEGILNDHLTQWETIYGTSSSESSLSLRFAGIIRRAHQQTGQRVVVLIDEYDKPLLQSIGNEPLQTAFKKIMKTFYGVLKTSDPYLQFAFLTGVTKFGKVSVFSDLNNLNDISLDSQYAPLCGITEEEIHTYFEEALQDLATAQKMSYEEVCKELRELYNGYHFSEESVGVYNPFSLLNTFAKRKFGSYWFATGTPTFLVELLKRDEYDLYTLAHEEATAETLDSLDSTIETSIPVIYQSGYLTIKGYDPRFRSYRLGFPNREVEEGFVRFLLPYYAKVRPSESAFHLRNFVQDVEAGDYDSFLTRLQSFFADTPYDMLPRDLELHYHNVLFIIFRLMGFHTRVEYRTNKGRIDLTLETPDYVYLMEFKIDSTPEEALAQIERNGYADGFAADPRKLYKVGVNFSNTIRGIEGWMVE